MVFGTQTLFAVFKRTGGKVWKIRKVSGEIAAIFTTFAPLSPQ